ncbi:MAG: hypothetical protein RLZZ244_2232 [Verrucomicrobiota bacterium]
MRRLMLGVACGVLLATGLAQWGERGPWGPWSRGEAHSAKAGGGGDAARWPAPKLDSDQLPSLAALEEDYTRLVQSVVPSVVSITTQKRIRQQVPYQLSLLQLLLGGRLEQPEQVERGLGSGVIVTKDGHILTNHHVVADMDQILVKLTDGRTEPADLVGVDPQADIAVLKIKGPVEALVLGDSDKVRVGQPVFAVGNPFGLEETVSQGIISAKGRAVPDSGVSLLQTDAAVNQGNSGGPLLNVRGEVIGINSAIYSKSGAWLGISFAIPSNVARLSMESILRTGKVQRQTLGISTTGLTPSLAAQYGLRAPVGALVIHVAEGSTGKKAGLQKDDVIVGFNGQLLASPSALQQALEGKSVGTRVQLNVIRDGVEYAIQVEVAALSGGAGNRAER